jgi:hypothetical protein
VWSSEVHRAIVGVQAFNDPAEHGHLIADAPALFLVAIIFGSADAKGSRASLSTVG